MEEDNGLQQCHFPDHFVGCDRIVTLAIIITARKRHADDLLPSLSFRYNVTIFTIYCHSGPSGMKFDYHLASSGIFRYSYLE